MISQAFVIVHAYYLESEFDSSNSKPILGYWNTIIDDTGACPMVTPKSDGSCAAADVLCFDTLKPYGSNTIFKGTENVYLI